ASWLTAPGEQQLVVLPSVVLEAVLPVHVESRLEVRKRHRVVAELVPDGRHVELHDDHRMVVERVAVELDGAARRRDRYPQLGLAVSLAAASGTREVQAVLEVGRESPPVGKQDTRLGIRVDAKKLLLCALEGSRTRARDSAQEEICVGELCAQHGR